MAEKYSCDNCGIFLGNNPFSEVFVGIFCMIVALAAGMGTLAMLGSESHHGGSSVRSIVALGLLVGAYDSAKRAVYAIVAMRNSRLL